MRSHLILILYDLNEDYLIQLYERKELDHYCFGIIMNQFNLKRSSFGKLYRQNNLELLNDYIYEEEEVNDKETIKNYIDTDIRLILDDFYYENVDAKSYFFNRMIFQLYFFDNKTLQQIAKDTRITYSGIRFAKNFTLDYVKKRIEQKR